MGSGNKKKQRLARRRRRQELRQINAFQTSMEVDNPTVKCTSENIVNNSINTKLSKNRRECENNMINEYIVISKDDVENYYKKENVYGPNYEPVKSKKFYNYFI